MKRFLMTSCLLLLAICVVQAQYTVKGTVVDENGESIIGASIVVKGTSNSTVTDFDGNFTLKVPSGTHTVSISYIGCKMLNFDVNSADTGKAILVSKNKRQDSQWQSDKTTTRDLTADEWYEKGTAYFTDGDNVNAFECYLHAANMNHPLGLVTVGVMYEGGTGVAKDLRKAVTYYQKAAKLNNDLGQSSLAWAYLDGNGVGKDIQQAIFWAEKAAKQGSAYGQFTLGYIYLESQDYTKALEWLKKAESQGDAGAANNLGWMYEHGLGVNKNYYTAYAYYKKAADGGNAGGMRHIGEFYENGWAVNQDMQEAMMWYNKAAEGGNEKAQERLQDMKDTPHWHNKEYRQRALLRKGRRHYDKGTELGYVKAFIYFCMASKEGSREACYFIGRCLEYGQGISQSASQANEWYKKSGYKSYQDVLKVVDGN